MNQKIDGEIGLSGVNIHGAKMVFHHLILKSLKEEEK